MVRYDVTVKPPDNTAPAERRAMMRALLEDRFNLRVHWEVRQLPVYALTLTRAGRLGPNLARSKFDAAPTSRSAAPTARPKGLWTPKAAAGAYPPRRRT